MPQGYNGTMVRPQRSGPELLTLFRRREAELRARGVKALTVFGSAARGEAAEGSDVDLAVRQVLLSRRAGSIISASLTPCGIAWLPCSAARSTLSKKRHCDPGCGK